jgi:hypothetical protein
MFYPANLITRVHISSHGSRLHTCELGIECFGARFTQTAVSTWTRTLGAICFFSSVITIRSFYFFGTGKTSMISGFT